MTTKSTATMMTTTIKRALIAALLAVGACGQASQTPANAQTSAPPPGSLFAAEPDLVWRLPNQLREISGLAVSPDGRLFAHDDERAVIYQIDITRGAIVKSFTLGETPLAGDYEGLAITAEGEFWITTSEGLVHRFREGADGAHVAYESFNTNLGDACEIEGLAFSTSEGLIFACKRNIARDMRNTIALYTWRPNATVPLWRTLAEADIARRAGIEHFRPSSLEIDPRTGRLLLLSARDAGLAELSPEGELLAARALGSGHIQAEGVAVLADGALAVADEAGDARALLSRYPRVP
ncbi:SdiA-regulated domain-containing protein [Vitreimonas flagellata]|uniref:SdiA-regulated domain-containing protein n=1 Tax=Vitreimonas flagellata TaxID=2560861 RepID=UPI0010751D35|nr:SdiA-regulated domain-containing protein [Vitreimonas flagellata]